MTEAHLPQHAIDEDHAYEKATESATHSLALHRWHWTLDESNPDRVALRAYARDVDAPYRRVYDYATGYQSWIDGDAQLRITIGEAIQRAGMSAEKEMVTDAVANALGMTFTSAKVSRSREVQHVRDLARQRAEEKGTTVEQEAPAIAKMMARVNERDIEVRDERLSRHGLRYIELEGYLVNMLRYGKKAAQLASEMHVDPEEQTLLQHTIDQVRRMLHVIDERIAGIDTVDWDAELASIMEGVS